MFDQKLFSKLIEARMKMAKWAQRAAKLKDAGKIDEARRAFATAEGWEAKVKAYEKKLEQRG